MPLCSLNSGLPNGRLPAVRDHRHVAALRECGRAGKGREPEQKEGQRSIHEGCHARIVGHRARWAERNVAERTRMLQNGQPPRWSGAFTKRVRTLRDASEGWQHGQIRPRTTHARRFMGLDHSRAQARPGLRGPRSDQNDVLFSAEPRSDETRLDILGERAYSVHLECLPKETATASSCCRARWTC